MNYYGPGTIEVNLNTTSKWVFRQQTRYPAEPTVRIEVEAGSSEQTPLYLRIPEWSMNTKVSVNGNPVGDVRPGVYLKLDRTWKTRDWIELELDFNLRLHRGDAYVNHNASLYRGPILLAFDQKHNTVEPDDMPTLDFGELEFSAVACSDRFQPLTLFKTTATDGTEIHLTDYATAGAHGTWSRSWLPIVQ